MANSFTVRGSGVLFLRPQRCDQGKVNSRYREIAKLDSGFYEMCIIFLFTTETWQIGKDNVNLKKSLFYPATTATRK